MISNRRIILTVLLTISIALPSSAYYPLPPLPPPDKFGDVVMDKVASSKGAKAVVFSHWSHRTSYTCRVCHYELNFEVVAGQTEISEEENREGEYCGACHDGVQAFGHTEEHCAKCHTGPQVDRRDKFVALKQKLRRVPQTGLGNRINWVEALRSGAIEPRYSLFRADEKPMAFDKRLELAAEMSWVPPAIFDHATHTPWLDCANCHPAIFNIKKKTTKHFRMEYILEKRFCGVCHLSVALPIDECHACHPKMKQNY